MILDQGQVEPSDPKKVYVNSFSAVVLLLIFSFFGELLAQELYRWVDNEGIVHFADSLHSIPEKYRREAEKRFFAPQQAIISPDRQSWWMAVI